MKKPLARILTVCAVALALAPATVSAAGVGKSWAGYTFIKKGVIDIGLENLLLYRTTITPIAGTGGAEDGETVATDVAYTGALTGRYFVIKNLAVGLSAGFFLRSASVETDLPGAGDEPTEQKNSDTGFIGFATGHYYVPLGNSFFLTPGLGAGYFTGTRETPVVGSNTQKDESTVSGIAGRFDLGAVFYAGPQFNLKAGLNVVGRFGSQTFEAPAGGAEPDPVDFTTIDAGFNIGLGYSF